MHFLFFTTLNIWRQRPWSTSLDVSIYLEPHAVCVLVWKDYHNPLIHFYLSTFSFKIYIIILLSFLVFRMGPKHTYINYHYFYFFIISFSYVIIIVCFPSRRFEEASWCWQYLVTDLLSIGNGSKKWTLVVSASVSKKSYIKVMPLASNLSVNHFYLKRWTHIPTGNVCS